MITILRTAIGLSAVLASSHLFAQEAAEADHASPYSGMETRAIKSLSQTDMEELGRGGGWGLALAAELNGVPGPAHLLEMKDEIGLTPDQVAAIEKIFAEMQTEAIAAGENLIAAEQALEAVFVSGNLDEDRLRILVRDAGVARANLRFVHLSRHLLTPPLLSEAQISKYNTLRGYDGADPCANVPEGHDADMWRKHNGCDG